MEVRIASKVLLNGSLVAHSTMSLVDIEVPGTHTFDLVRPDEDPGTTATPYQLVIEVEKSPTKPTDVALAPFLDSSLRL